MATDKVITVQRGTGGPGGTHGILLDNDGSLLCYTLEPVEPIIAPGIYPVKRYQSPTKGLVFMLYNVPDHYDVEIHVGNTIADTKGCILVGLGVTAGGIRDSRKALDMLLEKMPQAFSLEVTGGA